MRKIVINNCYGGFDLSHEAIMLYCKLKGIPCSFTEEVFYNRYYNTETLEKIIPDYIYRDDPVLVSVVEQLGAKASGKHSKLIIESIENSHCGWLIEDHDGMESIRT